MSFLKKSIPIFFFIFFFGIGAALFVQAASAAIGDSCVGSIPSGISGQPPISGTGTCQTIGSAACDPATMNIAVSTCAPAFCCFPKVATLPPTSCIYYSGQCVRSTNCSAIETKGTTGCSFGGVEDEVCCKVGAVITSGAPACTSVSGQFCLPSCGGTTPTPKSGFTCATGVCCGSVSVSGTPVPGGSGTPVPGGSTPTSITIINPLAFNTVEGVLGSLLGTLRGIIVVLSLVFIVIGAVLYITSAGDEGRMKTAKGAITASMIGLAIGIAAPSFLKQIGDVLGWGPVSSSLPAGTRTLTEIALSVLQFLLSVVGVLGIIMLVIGGLVYITAAGDEHRIDTGKKIVTYAVIGISVALASLIIVTQIAKLFV